MEHGLVGRPVDAILPGHRRRRRRLPLAERRSREGTSMSADALTIGVEEEFQIVDGEGQPRSHIDTLMKTATPLLGEQVKPEMLQSVVLVRTGCIPDGSKIWWDMRPHHTSPTLEFRVCDAATRVDEAVMLAAFVQAICAKLLKLRGQNLGFRKYLAHLIQENKWRAIRHGIDGKLIDFGKQQEVPMRALTLELLEFVDDVVDDLGSRAAVEYVHTVLREGTSADRQLRAFKASGHLHRVVDHLAEETLAGVAVSA